MALTKITAKSVEDDAITTEQIAHSTITDTNLADDSCIQAKIADEAVDEARLQISNAGSNGQFLQKQSSNTGGLTWATVSAGTALTGSTDNTVCTVTAANAIQGEANLTFDGSKLGIGTASPDAMLHISGSSPFIRFTDTVDDSHYAHIGHTDGSVFVIDADAANAHAGSGIEFKVDNTERLKIESDGNVKINDGDLVIGGTNHGINFAASQTNAGGMTSETLDSYEEGTWTPTLTFGGGNTGITYADATGGSYVKIGRQVIVHGRLNISNKGSSTGEAAIGGFPFTSANVSSGTSGIEGDAFFSYLHDIVAGEDHAHVMGVINNNATKITLRWNNNAGNNEVLDEDNFEADTSVSFGCTYPAA